MTLAELTDSEICELSLQNLALSVLQHLSATDEWNLNNFRVSPVFHGRSREAQECLNEATGWLVSNGVIAFGRPGQSAPESIFITRLGRQAIAEGLTRIEAGSRLAVDLHPLLLGARTQFLGGDFELAAFEAMRTVEIRVRDLAMADAGSIGVPLIRESFHPDRGPLRDPSLEPGERQAVSDLFADAIGAFKNPPSHRQVDYADPTEASEVVLLADLLQRLLDRTEGRLASNPKGTE